MTADLQSVLDRCYESGRHADTLDYCNPSAARPLAAMGSSPLPAKPLNRRRVSPP